MLLPDHKRWGAAGAATLVRIWEKRKGKGKGKRERERDRKEGKKKEGLASGNGYIIHGGWDNCVIA